MVSALVDSTVAPIEELFRLQGVSYILVHDKLRRLIYLFTSYFYDCDILIVSNPNRDVCTAVEYDIGRFSSETFR